MMSNHYWVALCSMVFTTVLVTACGSGNQTEEEREQQLEDYAESFGLDVDVNMDGGDSDPQVTINTPMGGIAGSNLALPGDFPDDVAVYPALNIFSATNLQIGYMLQGQTSDRVDQVADFYNREMAAKGWTDNTPESQSSIMRSLQFSKGNRRANINLMPGDKGTTVQISTAQTG